MSNPFVDLSPLLTASAEGSLQMTANASQECAAACEKYVAGLEKMLAQIVAANEASGFGSLNSGIELGKKFTQLLVGGGETLSLVDVLTQHIDVATRLKAVFLKAGADYARTEHENTQMIVEAGG